MEVKRIVVDELLDGYKNKKSVVEVEIYASYINESNKYVTEYYHNFIDNPLQVEDECVWKIEPNLKGSRFEWSMYKSPHEKIIKNIGGRFIFCPNCGKRIRYEEE